MSLFKIELRQEGTHDYFRTIEADTARDALEEFNRVYGHRHQRRV